MVLNNKIDLKKIIIRNARKNDIEQIATIKVAVLKDEVVGFCRVYDYDKNKIKEKDKYV